MKKYFLLLFAALLFACGENNKPAPAEDPLKSWNVYGDTISPSEAVEASQLASLMKGKDSLKVKVKGTISDVCQKKGCWMEIPLGNNESMRVRFLDYGFFVPKDAGGKEVIAEGYAYVDTISVDELRHYAEDAGDPEEKIEKIDQPKVEISFEASGVLIKK